MPTRTPAPRWPTLPCRQIRSCCKGPTRNAPLREIGDLFGRDFADALAALQPGPDWQGPLRSAYGWHLVQVEKALPEAPQPFAQVAVRVANDLDAQRRQDANAAYYEELRSRYQVVSVEVDPT